MIHTFTLTTADAERWRAVLPASVSVSGSVEYLRICEQQTGWPARLFVVADTVPLAAYPYFLRPVHALPFAGDTRGQLWDTCTPEYRGPIALNGGLPALADGHRFADLFTQHCREQRIVAEFAHLNPWDLSAELIEPSCVTANREIIYVDLTWNEETIWTRSLSSDGRRQTKQGQRAGVTVRRADSVEDVREFYRLYSLTMERRNALDRYRFPLRYFLSIFETMSASAFFVLAEYQGQAVAGGLFFQDRTNVYWHLSASDRDFSHVRAVNVYLYETIIGSLGHGGQRMIMGGGYEGDDGVLRFKTNFSPLRTQFCTYARVHDAGKYAALLTAWRGHFGASQFTDGFFPAYRSTPVKSLPAPVRNLGVHSAPDLSEPHGRNSRNESPRESMHVPAGAALG